MKLNLKEEGSTGMCVCVLWWQVHILQLFSSICNLEVASASLPLASQTATFLSCYISDGAWGFQFPLTGLGFVYCYNFSAKLHLCSIVIKEHIEPVAAIKLECGNSSPQKFELPGVHLAY